MRRQIVATALVVLMSMIGFAGNAQAGVIGNFFQERDLSNFYYGLGVSDGSIKVSGAGERSMGTVGGTFGMQLLELVGLELQVGSASDDAQSVLSESQLFYAAAMLRFGMRFDRVGVYGLMGQAVIDTSSQYNFSNTGGALGVGLNLFSSDVTSLNLHFLRLDDGAFTSASIGYQYYFGGRR